MLRKTSMYCLTVNVTKKLGQKGEMCLPHEGCFFAHSIKLTSTLGSQIMAILASVILGSRM